MFFCTHAQRHGQLLRRVGAKTRKNRGAQTTTQSPPRAPALDQLSSNSQQAMWETSHQQVRVKSAAGSRARCLLPCLLSPSLSARLRIDSRPVSTFRRRCESLHCPAAPLLKCADELTPSRQIRTCYLKSGLRSLINRSASPSALSRCLICRGVLAGRTLPLKP